MISPFRYPELETWRDQGWRASAAPQRYAARRFVRDWGTVRQIFRDVSRHAGCVVFKNLILTFMESRTRVSDSGDVLPFFSRNVMPLIGLSEMASHILFRAPGFCKGDSRGGGTSSWLEACRYSNISPAAMAWDAASSGKAAETSYLAVGPKTRWYSESSLMRRRECNGSLPVALFSQPHLDCSSQAPASLTFEHLFVLHTDSFLADFVDESRLGQDS